MVLEGTRIILREFRKEDKENYLKIANESSIKKYVPFSSPDNLKECAELMKYYSNMDFVNDFYFLIEDKITHQLVGALLCYRTETFALDVSYFIAKDFRGNGLILEALKLLGSYLLEQTVYKTMFFMIKKDNLPSIKVMEKLGAQILYNLDLTLYFRYQIKSAT